MTLAEIQKASPPSSETAQANALQANAIDARFARDDKFAADARDQATPKAFVTLLEKMWRGEAVDKASSEAMLETMKRCRTGAGRIKGLLPSNTTVAHKTGTIGGVVDDVGIIYLPDEAGHVAIAVLSKQTRATDVEGERAIAQIARYAYDYFMFTPRTGSWGPSHSAISHARIPAAACALTMSAPTWCCSAGCTASAILAASPSSTSAIAPVSRRSSSARTKRWRLSRRNCDPNSSSASAASCSGALLKRSTRSWPPVKSKSSRGRFGFSTKRRRRHSRSPRTRRCRRTSG